MKRDKVPQILGRMQKFLAGATITGMALRQSL
jgi:hypothetical protein